jgi:MFS family permease
VRIGETVANPCSHALVADYFPPRHRSVMMSLYLVGTHLGAAAALLFGGLLLQHWSTLCHTLPGGACGLPAWRAAFFILGWPGLLLALLVASLREPTRHHAAATVKPVRLILREFSAAVPPFTVFNLLQVGGWSAAGRNLAMAGVIVVVSAGIGRLTGDWPQWIAVAIGLYSVSTWAQVLRLRDAPLFKLTFGCPTFAFSMFGAALLLCFTGSVHVWSATYAMRVLGATPGRVGLQMGLTSAAAAIAGVILGGLVSDHFRRRDARGPIWVCLAALSVSVPAAIAMMLAHEFNGFLMAFAVFILASMSWSGAAAALVQDLVLPRMRATASAAFSLVIILVGTGIGPYWAGKVSTLTGSLTTGLYSLLVFVPAATGLLLMAANRLKRETAETRRDRARAAGEIL